MMNAIDIRTSENVENATYLDSLKFWENRIVKTVSPLIAIIRADKYTICIASNAIEVWYIGQKVLENY